tara:strand:- start:52 stop:1014 length:963 start_codon:yes stop_codon:yes gene_type:complete
MSTKVSAQPPSISSPRRRRSIENGETSEVVLDSITASPSASKATSTTTHRRRSAANGITTNRVEKIDNGINLQPNSASSELYVTELVSDYISSIMAADHVVTKMADWLTVQDFTSKMSANPLLLGSFMARLSEQLVTPLKLSRNGLMMRLLFSLACSYGDMVTDILMLNFYHTTGDETSFNRSSIILTIAIAMHVVNTILTNTHIKKKRTLALRIVQAFLCLNPAIQTYGKWSGNHREEGAYLSPSGELYFTKFIEVLFEALPQMVVQLEAMMRAESLEPLPLASLIFSIITAGIVITDASITVERTLMTDQLRGPYSCW